MPGVPGAGLRFAVPDVMNLQTSDWTAAIGARAFGQNGEMYRVAFFNETATSATGVAAAIAFIESATSALNTTSTTRASLFLPYVVHNSSASDQGAGLWARSVGNSQLAWVHCGGRMNVALTASAEASAENAVYFPVNSTAFNSAAVATGHITIAGGWLRNGPGVQTAISTINAAFEPCKAFRG
jgi:hypothetical protein